MDTITNEAIAQGLADSHLDQVIPVLATCDFEDPETETRMHALSLAILDLYDYLGNTVVDDNDQRV